MSNNSLEELKLRIEQNKLKSSSVDKSTLDYFLSYFNISQGSDKIETYLLYELYLELSNSVNNPSPMSKIDFFRKFGKLFTSIRHGNQRYYLLNKDIMRVPESLYFRIKINEKERKLKKIL